MNLVILATSGMTGLYQNNSNHKGKRMKRVLLSAVVLMLVTGIKAQQDPQFTQWMYDKLSFNPAVAGTEGANCLNLFYRQQWTNFEGSPESILFNYHTPIKQINSGVGITFYNDQLGQETNNVFRLSYAYHLGLANNNKLSFGIGLGYYGKQLGSDWTTPDTAPEFDEAISTSQESDGSFDLNLGAYFFKPGEYYIGLSATHLTSQDLNDLNIEMATHLYFMAGYIYPLNDDFKIRPNLLVKSDANETTLDFNANVLWNNMLWAGLSFRTEDALAPMLGFQTSWNNEDETLPQTIRVGYSYDVTTSEIRNYSSGSHEIMVTYCFSVIDKILMKKHYNPRFL